MSPTAIAWLLGAALVGALIAIGVLTGLLLRARRAEEELTDTIELQLHEDRNPRAIQTAGKVVRTVVDTATRVREQGMTSAMRASLDDFTRWALEDRGAIVRVAGEDGTVTIFFSDIEGSTALNASLGDARWVRTLSAHNELVELYVDRYRGHIVKTQGDGYMVVFSTPELAIRAALDIQKALGANWNRSRHLRRTPLRVRIGLHTGIAIEKNGDYFGQTVAMAARVAQEAQGGEILVTSGIAEALGDAFTFQPAEAIELKGFEGDHQLWHVPV